MNKSLFEYSPSIAAEWHPTKNGDLLPTMIAPRSNKKVWWLCPNGHDYAQTPDHRVGRGAGCPYCSGKKVLAGYNDLATVAPDLTEEWNHSRNTSIDPTGISAHSHKKVWWKCKVCGHEWQASVNDRSNNRGCPVCAKKERAKSQRITAAKRNNLAHQRPDLVEEWDFEKNGDLTPDAISAGSNQKVWWKCKDCGHEWQAAINNRAGNNSGCPRCMRHKGTSFPEQAIFFYLKKMFPDTINSYTEIFPSDKHSAMELDVYIPSVRTGIEYDGAAWHHGKRAFERELKKYEFCKKNGIKLIRITEIEKEPTGDIIIVRKNNSNVALDQAIKNLILHITSSSIDIDTVRDRAAIMRQYITTLKEKSIAAKYPESVIEWDIEKNDGLTADMVNAVSQDKYWWKCDKGHSYQSTPANKLPYGYGCPYCSGHQLLTGFNDLETKYPELAKEWDYDANTILPSEIMSGSTKKVWWRCEKGHSYQMTPNNRTSLYSGCPYCSGHQVLAGFNDLSTTHPKISKMWDYRKNAGLTPEKVSFGSNKKAWWLCDKGHSFKKTIALQVKSPSCPVCEGRQLEKGVNDLSITHPNLSQEWNTDRNFPLTSCDVTFRSTKKVWWKCKDCGHEWQSKINIRILSNTGCPKCGYSKKIQETRQRNTIRNKKTLQDKFPEIALEWDFERNGELSPDNVSFGANHKVWWVCPKQHHYQAWITDRTGKHKTGCPYCAGKRKLLPGQET